MMKIGTITFHGSHNYGSVLQAYALQEYVIKLLSSNHVPCEYQIINFRSDAQKQKYAAPKPDSIKHFLKWRMYVPYRKPLALQALKFEQFIEERLSITEEFSSASALPDIASRFDILIAGSDQIWNIRAKDFDFAYLFPGCSARKISYAASLGPLSIDWGQYDAKTYADLLREFESISVREKKSKEMLLEVIEGKDIEILPDPTLLLSCANWRKIESDMNPGRYILFYCLEPTREHIRIAQLLSRKLQLPVITTRYRNKYDYFNPFIKQYDAGPCDFLSLVDHATAILTSSFHGTVFSLIYGKPFYVINGMEDGRIRDILKLFGAEKNNLPFGLHDVEPPFAVKNTESVIRCEQEKARAYLTAALGLSVADDR